MAVPPKGHPFADLIGLEFQHMGEGTSACSLTVVEALMNPHGVVHGAAMYALADTGMGGALYPTLASGEICATIEIKMTYFRAVRAGVIACETVLVHRGRRVAALESTLTNDGHLIAKATGSYSIFRT